MNYDVLLVSSSFPYGPGEGFLESELEALADAGVSVLVVPVWARGARSDWRPPGCVRIEVAGFGDLRPNIHPISAVKQAWEDRRLHAGRGGATGFYPALRREVLSRAVGLHIAELASQSGVRHVHAYWATGPASAARVAAEVTGLPWSITAHAGDIYNNHSLPRRARSASFIRVISEVGRRCVVELGVPTSKVHTVHIGVKIPESPAGRRTSPSGVLRGVCPAMLIRRKGHAVLLEALALLRESGVRVLFDFAGDGPESDKLRGQAKALGLAEDVSFLGHVPRSGLLGAYEAGYYDLMVLPTVGEGEAAEGIPVSLMEAMSYGIPSISTNNGGTAELIPEGSPLLVAPGDVCALARAIQALAASPAARLNASQNGRLRVEQEFNAAKQGVRLAGLMKSARDA